MRLVVGCHKGGVAKTTSAVLLALQLARDAPTVLIDGDGQGSASTWARLAGETWPVELTVVPWSERFTLPPAWSGHVVVDTGPGNPARLRTALRHCDTALVPVGSRRADVVQLGETIRTVEDVAADRPVSWACVLTMVRLSTKASREASALIERDYPLLRSVVPLSESIAAAFGTVPDPIPGAYRQVFEEITAAVVHA
jgi:cellulose biosynthesis protein BcsQ